MTLDDAVFNWLQIKYVAEERSEDHAAQETYQFFTEILKEDHKLENIQVKEEEGMFLIQFIHEDKEREKSFPVKFVQQLLNDIESEPKFNQ